MLKNGFSLNVQASIKHLHNIYTDAFDLVKTNEYNDGVIMIVTIVDLRAVVNLIRNWPEIHTCVICTKIKT